MAKATVLFATQMGNSEEVAKQICKTALSQGLEMDLHSMSELGSGFQLTTPGIYVFVLSSTGDGEVPDTARSLLKHLRSLPNAALAGVKYALLGLGDSNFSTFQGGPKTLNSLLESVGAEAFHPRGIADEASGLSKGVEQWLSGLWTPLRREIETVAGGTQVRREVSAVAGGDNPEILQGRILECKLISEPNAVKKLYELTIDSCGRTYAAGSNISVYPDNDSAAVSEICARLALDVNTPISDLKLIPPSVRWRASLPMTLNDLFLRFIELSAPVPKGFGQFFLEHLSDSTEVRECGQIVQEAQGKLLPVQWSLLGLLRRFTSFTIGSLESLLPQLPALRSRFFSISSSPLLRPSSFTIAFCVEGVCTRYMDSLARTASSAIRFSYPIGDSIFLKPLLEHDRVIFVSTGTGLSPFKGVLEHVQRLTQAQKPVWVFHGCRQTTRRSEALNYDFLYEEEVKDLVKGLGGKLTTTASRSGEAGPKYVQDALRAASSELSSWNQVAIICGSFNTEEMKTLLISLCPGIHVVVEDWE